MRRIHAIVVAALLPTLLTAQHLSIAPATGPTGQSTWVFRLGGRIDFRQPHERDSGGVIWFVDAGYTWWMGYAARGNITLSLAPVFVYEFAGAHVVPFVEAGVGVGAMSHARIEHRNLGSRLLFEDRVGAGVRIGAQVFGFRAIHYSNAGLCSPNDGAETYTLYYSVAI